MALSDSVFYILSEPIWGGGKNKRTRWANYVLLFISYALYAQWNVSYTLVLLFVTLVTYCGALVLEQNNISRKKAICSTFAVAGILPLLIFKYYNFTVDSIQEVLGLLNFNCEMKGLNWAIPLGLSFFTFQAVGYLLDVYHKRIPAEKNFWDYALFVSFFPQILSGPLSKAQDLLPQIKSERAFDESKAVEGLKLLLWGLFMKSVFADRVAIYADTVFNNYIHQSGITLFLGSIFYTLQIYGDFAGYSLMAVGTGKVLGFDLINNFNRPYFATSITEFWKRWHISLTRWLTTHVYINLGGNRCSKARQYMNIMITFLVSGLWHGANWTFVIWGAIHGVLQVVEKALGIAPKGKYYDRIESLKWLRPVRIVITFLLVNIAWIFFRMPTISDSFNYIVKMFTVSGSLFLDEIKSNNLMYVMAILIVLSKEVNEEYSLGIKLFENKSAYVRWLSYLFVIVLILLFGVLDATQFIYVSF